MKKLKNDKQETQKPYCDKRQTSEILNTEHRTPNIKQQLQSVNLEQYHFWLIMWFHVQIASNIQHRY